MMNNQQNGTINNTTNGALKTQSQGNLPVFTQAAFIPSVAQEEDELNLRQVFSVVKHRWWLIAGITLGVTGAIVVWTFLKTPIYEGRFLLPSVNRLRKIKILSTGYPKHSCLSWVERTSMMKPESPSRKVLNSLTPSLVK
jgi:hypothetical protein